MAIRVKQLYVSDAVSIFKDKMIRKYDLVPVTSDSEPVVIFGMYSDADYRFCKEHKSKVITVLCGDDALKINKQRAEILKGTVNYAMSSHIARCFDKFGISYTLLPITPTEPNISPSPRGGNIYCYIGVHNQRCYQLYKWDLLQEVRKKVGQRMIIATFNTYNREELMEIYRSCFVGLRLRDHDGLPNSVLELGMTGSRTICNSEIPGTIGWKSRKDILVAVKNQFERRHEDNTQISKAIKNYINIGDKWLNV